MSKFARSARGELVDFDLLAIKQQLAMMPVPVGVDERRRFIDEKDGLKTKQSQDASSSIEQSADVLPAVPSALSLSLAAAEESAAALDDEVPEDEQD
jgi:hypothetical protein